MSNQRFAMSLTTASVVAKVVTDALAPVCDRIAVAGSLRRGGESCHDIDIVCAPRIEPHMDPGVIKWDPSFLACVKAGGAPAAGGPSRWAVTNKALDQETRQIKCQGIKEPRLSIEIFCSTLDRFGWIYLLRTGDEQFTTTLVTLCQRRGPGFFFQKGMMYRRPEPGAMSQEAVMVPTPEESDIFEALQIPFIEPKDRAQNRLERAIRENPWPVEVKA